MAAFNPKIQFILSGEEKRLVEAVRRAREETRRAKKETQEYKGVLRETGTEANRFGQALLSIGAGAIGFHTITRSLTTIIDKTLTFQEGMNRVWAVTGATDKEFDKLKDKAKELGRTTRFTASEVAGGMVFLAQAGYDVNEVLTAIEPTLNLAGAGMLDMASAGDIVTNVLGSFRMQATDLVEVVDQLSAVATNSNTNIRRLGQAISYVGPIAQNLGVTLPRTLAVLGELGNQGIPSDRAGTGFRVFLAQLSNPTPQALEIYRKFNVVLRDRNGLLRDGVEIVSELQSKGATDQDLDKIFEIRAKLIASALQGRGEEVDALEQEALKAVGTAEEIREKIETDLVGATYQLKSAWEGLNITIGESPLFDIVVVRQMEGMTGLLRDFNKDLEAAGTMRENIWERLKDITFPEDRDDVHVDRLRSVDIIHLVKDQLLFLNEFFFGDAFKQELNVRAAEAGEEGGENLAQGVATGFERMTPEIQEKTDAFLEYWKKTLQKMNYIPTEADLQPTFRELYDEAIKSQEKLSELQTPDWWESPVIMKRSSINEKINKQYSQLGVEAYKSFIQGFTPSEPPPFPDFTFNLQKYERDYEFVMAFNQEFQKLTNQVIEQNKLPEWVSDLGTNFEEMKDTAVDSFKQMIIYGSDAEDVLERLARIVLINFAEGSFSEGGWLRKLLSGERAYGGPVSAGGLYEVGERGRELFVPSTDGYIVPNGQYGGSKIEVNTSVVVEGNMTEEDSRNLANEIASSVVQAQQREKMIQMSRE